MATLDRDEGDEYSVGTDVRGNTYGEPDLLDVSRTLRFFGVELLKAALSLFIFLIFADRSLLSFLRSRIFAT